MSRYNVASESAYLFGHHPESLVYVEMSPKTFLRSLYGFGIPTTEGGSFYVSPESLRAVEARMVEGLPLDPLWFDYDPFTDEVLEHEGRHRALAAIQLGIERVPVVVYFYDRNGLHDKTDRFGRVYDQTHFVPRDELGQARIDEIVKRFDARIIPLLAAEKKPGVSRRAIPEVRVRGYRRRV